jgi:hypothetical protein
MEYNVVRGTGEAVRELVDGRAEIIEKWYFA